MVRYVSRTAFSIWSWEAQSQLFMLCQKDGATQDQIEKAVRDTYRTMQMMLAES